MAPTPGVIVADAVAANLAKASWISRMFEPPPAVLAAARGVLDSRELHQHAYKQERGADKVFDFTLGNPQVEEGAGLRTGSSSSAPGMQRG